LSATFSQQPSLNSISPRGPVVVLLRVLTFRELLALIPSCYHHCWIWEVSCIIEKIYQCSIPQPSNCSGQCDLIPSFWSLFCWVL
jgi:hypothetical protein